MKFWKILLAITLAVGVSDILSEDVFARPGGSRSSPSRSSPSRSPSRSTPSKTSSGSSWGTRKPATSSTRSSTTKSTPKRSATDQKAYDKAKASGTAFESRSKATSAFKTKHATEYKSTYTAKPETRPSHIPESTKVGGTTYNVTYNQQHGGYGYMGPSGSWMMYNAMGDALMLSMLMRQNNYHYDTVPISQGQPVVVVRRGLSGLMIFFGVVGSLIVVVVVVVVIGRSGGI